MRNLALASLLVLLVAVVAALVGRTVTSPAADQFAHGPDTNAPEPDGPDSDAAEIEAAERGAPEPDVPEPDVPEPDVPGPDASDSGCPPRTLCDESAAIAAALNRVPVNANAYAAAARLMTLDDALAWRGASLGDPDDPSSKPSDGFGQKLAWLVAIRGAASLDAIGSPADRTSEPELEGYWLILIASGGDLNSMGGLVAPGSRGLPLTYDSIAAKPTFIAPVSEPTP